MFNEAVDKYMIKCLEIAKGREGKSNLTFQVRVTARLTVESM